MKIAVAGCIHGELEKVYDDIRRREAEGGFNVELLLICGDFQSVRNRNDLKCMAVKPKFAQLGSFHKYYTGAAKAPILTIFIGGNHEASNYLMTLPYGGWVCPNIYYMGYSNVLQYKGLRIGGMSGIYKKYSADWGHFESLPFDEDTKRSIYHVRRLEAYRFHHLQTSTQPIDIFLSHDWPLNIHKHGYVHKLLKIKPFFRDDINNEALGNPLALSVLKHLQPRYWFAAHLHVRFEAVVNHSQEKVTNFLALDKCLPRRPYLEFVDIDPVNSNSNSNDVLSYDPEWLVVLKQTNQFLSTEKKGKSIPSFDIPQNCKLDEQLKMLKERFDDNFQIASEFIPCKPLETEIDSDPMRVQNFCNPQTTAFCQKMELDDPTSVFASIKNSEEIDLSDSDDETDDSHCKKLKTDITPEQVFVIDTKGSVLK